MAEPITIDVRGLKCPLPVLKAERRMRDFAAGTHFIVLATDPMAAIDLPHFCGEKGHRLLNAHRDGNLLRFEIEKA
jgi:tRNA 2-thiouridine synthesizing protein A